MDIPQTRYAKSAGLYIGYQVLGHGPPDVALFDQWYSNVDLQWQLKPLARFIERIASFSRLITLDKRGTGISDPVSLRDLPTLEEWMDDIRAVIDAVGCERVALLSGAGASYTALLFAATYPERTSALILIDGYARVTRTDDYPIGRTLEQSVAQIERMRESWGTGVLLDVMAPAVARDPEIRRSYSLYERQSASPSTAAAMLRVLYESDVRRILPAIRVPTLVLTHADATRIEPAHGRYVADHVAGARYVQLPGTSNFPWAADQDAIFAEVQEFLTGVRPAPPEDRVLATVLFTDIVGSTERAASLGDRRWRELVQAHEAVVRAQLERFRGREIRTEGDGFLATFDGPARAIRCALAAREALRPLAVEIRAGLHTGEIELMGTRDIGGIAVHIGARVAALAQPGEVLVSSTVKDLVVGSGIAFQDRGAHPLKGVPGTWQVFAAAGE